MRLQNKCVIVTGSTTGIGEAIAREAVAEGARVLIHGRDRDRGESIVKDLKGAAVFHCDDLADPGAPQRLVNAAYAAFGRIDGIVNNAAWLIRSNLATTDLALFDRAIAINLRAPLMIIRAGIEHLKKSKGCVINIGSVNGYSGESKQLAYSITKGGMTTMTRNLADALGADQVRVVQLTVGWVLTPNEYNLKIAEGRPENWHADPPPDMVPTGAMTRPENVAKVATFWLSDDARPFSGGVFELEQYPWLGRHPKMVGEKVDPIHASPAQE
jgi:NAD(P)-dependent dehydrogenase (short-subunit alcohol dehydrogenase family)